MIFKKKKYECNPAFPSVMSLIRRFAREKDIPNDLDDTTVVSILKKYFVNEEKTNDLTANQINYILLLSLLFRHNKQFKKDVKHHKKGYEHR